MPPLSCSCTLTVAVPFAFAAVVKVKVPVGEIAGCAENSALLSLLTMKFSACPASSGGPAEIAVAQFVTVCAGESSSTA